MRGGGWIPIIKALRRSLPHDRPYTELEAMYSISLDYDEGNTVTIKGYAVLWQWSRGKVGRFLKEIGVLIEYPSKTSEKQNQRGQIVIQMPSTLQADRRQIRIIDSRCLEQEANRKRADNQQIVGRPQGTTLKPDPEPKPEPVKPLRTKPKQPASDSLQFDRFWEAYPRKVAKTAAEKAWKKICPDEQLVDDIIIALEQQKTSRAWHNDDGAYIPYPEKWLNGRRWADEVVHSEAAPGFSSLMDEMCSRRRTAPTTDDPQTLAMCARTIDDF